MLGEEFSYSERPENMPTMKEVSRIERRFLNRRSRVSAAVFHNIRWARGTSSTISVLIGRRRELLRGYLLFGNQLILLLRPIQGKRSKQPIELEPGGLLPFKDRLNDRRRQQCQA